MKLLRGFGKNYFTLAAIQAYSSATTLHAQTSQKMAHLGFSLQSEEAESESPPNDILCLDLPKEPDPIRGNRKPCFCNHFFKQQSSNALKVAFLNQAPLCKCRKTKSGIAPPSHLITQIKITILKRKIMKKIILFTLLLTFAQAEVLLEPLTVTAATNSEQIVTDLPENVTVITADDIEQSHATTLPEALSRLAGIAFSNNGGLGKSTSMFLRGFDSKRTLLLINGVRYNNPTSTSGAQFQDITLDEIERIEIIKGAQSGVWGADASAGVINIITKKAKKGTKLFANIEEGTYGFHKTSVSLFHKNDSFDLKLSSSQLKSEGFSASSPNFGEAGYGTKTNLLSEEKDGYVNATTDFTIGFDISTKDRIEVAYRSIDAYVEYDDYNSTLLSFDKKDLYNRTKNKFYTLGYKHNGENNDFSLLYALSDFNSDQYGGYTGNVQEVTLKDKFSYADNSFFQIGANNQRYENYLSAGSDLNKSYDVYAFYLTNYNKFGSTILSESLRNDTFSTFGSTTTGKVGLKQFIADNYYLSANIGTGYNVPTMYHLYDPWSGNSALQPESTINKELSIGNRNFSISYFYNEVTNLIAYDFSTWKYKNDLGVSVIKGVEFGTTANPTDSLDIGFNYTYLDAVDTAGLALARRPKHQADLRLTYAPTADLSFLTHIQYIGTRYDKANNLGVQTGEYAVVNLVLNYTLDKNFKSYVKLDNAFDTFYQVVDGYTTAGRSCYIGLSASY